MSFFNGLMAVNDAGIEGEDDDDVDDGNDYFLYKISCIRIFSFTGYLMWINRNELHCSLLLFWTLISYYLDYLVSTV